MIIFKEIMKQINAFYHCTGKSEDGESAAILAPPQLAVAVQLPAKYENMKNPIQYAQTGMFHYYDWTTLEKLEEKFPASAPVS